MTYAKTFVPPPLIAKDDGGPVAGRDLRDGSIYVFSKSNKEDPVVIAVNVALATRRPLLLCGPPGTGKSSLAAFVAKTMNWNYFEEVITSRTSAQDLLWSFDAVRRLRDAHAKKLRDEIAAYITPRAIWWAFDPGAARRRGLNGPLPKGINPITPPRGLRGEDHPSVVLLDEIDKADPDVPNDLLVAIGSQQFSIPDIDEPISAKLPLLVVITSNNERTLPKAFLRRCIVHWLDHPDKEMLVKIAHQHLPDTPKGKRGIFDSIAELVVKKRQTEERDTNKGPSIPEYLDAVRACLELGVTPDASPKWSTIESIIFAKRDR